MSFHFGPFNRVSERTEFNVALEEGEFTVVHLVRRVMTLPEVICRPWLYDHTAALGHCVDVVFVFMDWNGGTGGWGSLDG